MRKLYKYMNKKKRFRNSWLQMSLKIKKEIEHFFPKH